MAALVAALSACAVGPDFTSPAPPPVFTYDAAGMPVTTVSAGDGNAGPQIFTPAEAIPAEWWTLFHSAALNRLIADALQNNPSLQAAQATLRAANESVAAGDSALFPAITGNVGSSRQKIAGASYGGDFPSNVYTVHNATLSLSYSLDVFGGVRRQIESLEAQRDFQRYELEATYISLTANVVTAAVLEASLRDQIAATEKIVKTDQDELNVLTQQFQLGGIAKTPVLAQQTVLAQAKATLPPLRQQLAQARHQLAVLTGHTPDAEPLAQFTLASFDLPKQLPVSLPSALVEQRPDIKAAEANLHAASAGIGVAIAARLPDITLTADVGSVAGEVGKLFTPGSGIWTLAGSASQTLFDAGLLAHRQRAAEAEYDIYAAQYRQTVLTAFEDVADTLRALQEDAATLAAQEEADQAAVDSLNLTRDQFKAGGVSYIALITAEQTEQQTKLSSVQVAAQRYADTAALFMALGGGWWNRQPGSPLDNAVTTGTVSHPAGIDAVLGVIQ